MGKNRRSKVHATESRGVATRDRQSDEAEDRFDTSKPQFRNQQKKDNKVVLDERFSSVLTDERFHLDIQDKYGRRRRNRAKNPKNELSEFYTIEKDSEATANAESQQPRKNRNVEAQAKRNASADQHLDSDNESLGDRSSDGDNAHPSSRIAYLTALSRGLIDVSSSSSDESSSEDGDGVDDSDSSIAESKNEGDEVDENLGVLNPSSKEADVEFTHEETPFLAVLNLDWSHLRAVDIFALLSSFAPAGAVTRVSVFLSDFGKQKLAEEERMGPGIWKVAGTVDDAQPIDVHSTAANTEDSNDDKSNADNASDGSDSLDSESLLHKAGNVDAGYDPEKLRAYEAAKLKYYFAVVEFSSATVADSVYREVDGLEFEHSSASVDLRAIQPSEMEEVIRNREIRDEAYRLPSNYVPPDFVVGALQQTNVQCTWEAGDRDREITLTKYALGEAWKSLAESDDLKVYLASDASSDDENGLEIEKAASKRKLLGLDSDEEEQGIKELDGSAASESESESEESREEEHSKEVTYVPGQLKSNLEEKIRSKLQASGEETELTPWEKYQQKRKETRKERRQAARANRDAVKKTRDGQVDSDDSSESSTSLPASSTKQTREELELLLAGDEKDEETRDYDMRELQRLEKIKDKKLRGSRKRKEIERSATTTGVDFQVNLRDERFKAVLEGDDDRFGIDRTNPNFKETPAMKVILNEQARRRKAKKQKDKRTQLVAPDVSAENSEAQPSSGAATLRDLVTRIKSKVTS